MVKLLFQTTQRWQRYPYTLFRKKHQDTKKQENRRTEDVYNHLHEETEQDDDTYDHVSVAPNHSTDLSEYSDLRDIATVHATSPSVDGGDYSTLGHRINNDCQ